ncbi:MAG TPA: class II glutamine amidotransferase [Actinomycetota bacterium]
MCELLAVAWDRPEPFGRILPWARGLERVGIAGYGWGVAWLDGEPGAAAAAVRGYRHPTSLEEDPEGAGALSEVRSTRFLVHLRRPNRLSTVQLADSQPFVDAAEEGGPGTFAFCHNGLLERHAEIRPAYEHRLKGRADSEVGFVVLSDLMTEGASAEEALPEVHRRFGGKANFGFLSRDGALLAYGGNPQNAFWRFALDGAQVAATQVHSDDLSLFDLLFDRAERPRQVLHRVDEVGPARESAAGKGPGSSIREAAG